jgi:hypothetical protein
MVRLKEIIEDGTRFGGCKCYNRLRLTETMRIGVNPFPEDGLNTELGGWSHGTELGHIL